MSDIKKAIEAEAKYIQDKVNGLDVTPLRDILAQYGFDSLDTYFNTKREHLFNQLEYNLVECTMPGGVSEIFNMVKTNEPGILFVDWEDTYVVSGNEGLETLNKEYCETNGISIFPLRTGGGTIVGSAGDFSFAVQAPKNIVESSKFILNKVKDIVSRHTPLPVSVGGNDICVDGKKICGSANYASEDMSMCIMHFSFDDWSELISNICKPNKIGKEVGFVDFMTRDESKSEVLEWLL